MYEIFIGSLKLPLLPENLSEDLRRDNKKHNILSLGEIVSPGRKKLRTWTIKSIFYNDEIDVTKARDYLVKLFDYDKKGKEPVRFIVNRYNPDGTLTFDTNTLVLIEALKFEDRSGEVGDLNYDIKLIEYVKYGGKKLK